MKIEIHDIAKILRDNNDFYILTHKSPDGDTLGSAAALCLALQKMDKSAKILCSDEIPKKYGFLFEHVKNQNFEPGYIISVDVADTQLLGDNLSCYADRVDLCIDHHLINQQFARVSYVESGFAATAEIIYEIINALGVTIDADIASCIYTGISTDTGCFRHSNATSHSYRVAADMIDRGANAFEINKVMFDTKSRAKLSLEKIALESLEFFCYDKCAMITLTNDEIIRSGACSSDFDGLSAIPRQIEGVLIGVFIKEEQPGIFKVSMRTDAAIDASEICANFNGGGHRCAAGCTICGNLADVKNRIISQIERYLRDAEG